jgi:hypothetical protein
MRMSGAPIDGFRAARPVAGKQTGLSGAVLEEDVVPGDTRAFDFLREALR